MQSASQNNNINYRPEIDGLRAIAVLSVILFHAGFEFLKGGFLGVDIFFVISGYLISKIILTSIEQGSFSYKDFYQRRVRRILPALMLVILTTLIVGLFVLLPNNMVSLSKSAIAASLMLANVFFYKESSYFNADSQLEPLLHIWSLSVEEQYYLIFPALLLLGHSIYVKKSFQLSLLIILITITSLAYAEFTWRIDYDKNFYLLFSRAWELGAGAFVAKIELNQSPKIINSNNFFAWFGFLLVIFSLLFYSPQLPVPSIFTLIPVIGACLCLMYGSLQTHIGRLLGSPLLVNIGLISYSLYLWHQPILAFAKFQFTTLNTLQLVLCLVLTFLFAFLSWRFIETPFRDKQKTSFKAVTYFVLSLTVITIVLSLYGVYSGGMPNRFSTHELSVIKSVDFDAHKKYLMDEREKRKASDVFKPLENTNQPILFIIGDSFSEDVYNGLIQSKRFNDYQIRLINISTICQFYIGTRDISNLVGQKHREFCKHEYEKYKNIPRFTKYANTIIVAMNWDDVIVSNINETYKNLNIRSDQNLFILGRKSFQTPPKNKLIRLSNAQLIGLKFNTNPDVITTNQILKSKLPDNIYIDQQKVICNDNLSACNSFTDDGELISHDGAHLTKAGAKFVWQKIEMYLDKKLLTN